MIKNVDVNFRDTIVDLDGSETEVRFGAKYAHFALANNSDGNVLMSMVSGKSVTDDGVRIIPPGESATISTSGLSDKIFAIGTGRVQISALIEPINPFKSSSKGGDSGSGTSGVTKAYVDSADATTLHSAKAYTDAAASALDTRVTANETAIATLNGTGEGSVTKTVTDKVAEIVAGAPEDFDTLKEMSDWISSHSESAAAMNSTINANTAEIAEVRTELSEKADSSDIEPLQNEIADLKAYIGYTDSDIYGLEADFENNVFTRLAGAVGKSPGADFDSINAYGGRRRCAVANNGDVVAYYGDDNYEEDGQIGSVMVQTMVEQPKFYYKVVPLKTEKIEGADGYHLRKARYYISDTPKAGFKIHPAFIRNGVEVDKIYLSAFEGCIYDTSAGTYLLNDEQLANFDTDWMSSRANAKPASGATQTLTRANARKLAQNRGDGWDITTIQTLSATQLLFAIEYAMFNSQTAIGNGVVNATETIETGSTSSLGNASGSVASGGVSYRGEENLWGNVSAFIDGCTFVGEESITACVVDDVSLFIPKNNGFVSSFNLDPQSKLDWCFVPSEKNGNSALPIGDQSYSQTATTGEITPVFGGYWGSELNAGIFFIIYRMGD